MHKQGRMLGVGEGLNYCIGYLRSSGYGEQWRRNVLFFFWGNGGTPPGWSFDLHAQANKLPGKLAPS